MRLSIEVETASHEDARLIARGLTRLAELQRDGKPIAVTVTAGRRRRRLKGLVEPADFTPAD